MKSPMGMGASSSFPRSSVDPPGVHSATRPRGSGEARWGGVDLAGPKLEKRAAHVRLERHPAKIQTAKKSKKVYF